jgi:exopolysaccharide production protein ExoY
MELRRFKMARTLLSLDSNEKTGALMDSMLTRGLSEREMFDPETGRNSARRRTPSLEILAMRVLDIAIAVFVLVLLAPSLALVVAAVYLSDGGAPIYAQRRIGQGGTRFPCFKFRSMVVDADERLRHLLANDPAARNEWARDHKLRNDPRITALGRFLRKSSIDELPQLFNVIRGEMSIVGPRPIVDGEISRYGRRFSSYMAVLPGLTGLWQVSGRNNTTYRRRVALDHVYAQRVGLGIYMWILVKTLPAVLLRRGSF